MLLDDWLQSPRTDRGLHMADASDGWTFRPYSELAAQARGVTSRLQQAGVVPGSSVMLLFTRQGDFAAAFFGVLGAGCTPTPVAPPAAFGGGGARYDRHLATLMHRAGSTAVLTDDKTAAVAERAACACTPRPVVIRVNAADPVIAGETVTAAIPDLALLQFTSGSSGTPKGVRVTKENLSINIAAIGEFTRMTEGSSGALWLPHYHDMGLMSLLLCVTSQFDLWLMTPQQFIRDPLRWLHCFGVQGATTTACPPFGLAYAARRVTPEQMAGMDYSTWTGVVLGAERIDPAVVVEFVRLAAPFGFRASTLMPAYGMAETTLICTGITPGTQSVIRELESPVLRMGEPVKFGAAGILGIDEPREGTWLTECGAPISGMEVDIVDENGVTLRDGYLGEIRVRGTSLTAGYHNTGAEQADANNRFTGNGFRTGDSGAIVDRSLYVVGRIGDSLKVRGAAVHAEDLELELARELRLIPYQVAVLLGTLDLVDLVVVVLNAELDEAVIARVATLVQGRTRDFVAIAIVRGGAESIQRTSSGKPRRRVMWRAIGDGELPGELVHTTWHQLTRTVAPWESEQTARSEGDAA